MKKLLLLCLFLALAPLYAQLARDSVTSRQLYYLQKQVDSLKNAQRLTDLEYRANQQVEVVNKVDSFYQSSFGLLLLAFTIIGVIIPITIQIYQNLLVRKSNKKAISKLKAEIKSDQEILQKSFENNLAQLNHISGTVKLREMGIIFYLQAQTAIAADELELAVYNTVMASKVWSEIDEGHSVIALDYLQKLLPKLTPEGFKKVNKLLADNNYNDGIIGILTSISSSPLYSFEMRSIIESMRKKYFQ